MDQRTNPLIEMHERIKKFDVEILSSILWCVSCIWLPTNCPFCHVEARESNFSKYRYQDRKLIVKERAERDANERQAREDKEERN